MKDSCKPGLEATHRISVDEPRVVRHMGPGLGVYATPAMVRDMEQLCHDLLQEHLDDGEESVGTRVDIQHLAATPEGMWVDIHTRLTAVDGRAVTFELEAHDALDQAGKCTHQRFIVDLDKVKQRLTAKIEKTKGAQA